MPIRMARLRDPKRSESLCDDAETLLARGERLAAAEALEHAMRFEPDDEELPLMAAGLFFDAGRLARAAGQALESIRIRPFNPSAWNLLGVICLDAGYENLARKILERSCRMAPGFERARRNLKQARRACRRRGKSNERPNPAGDPPLPLEAIREMLRPRAPRLTACVLARDETGLADCLESLENVADEIRVVDATEGGELGLPSAATRCRVEHFRWDGDLAAARNELVRQSRGDWILIVDGTERLENATAPALGEALRDGRALAHAVRVHYGPEEGGRREVRLLRNAPGLRFTGGVLAELRPALKDHAQRWGLRQVCADVSIHHPGPAPLAVSWQSERAALVRALESGLQEGADDYGKRLCGARRDVAVGSTERALEALEGARQALSADAHGTIDAEKEEIVTLEGLCLFRLERWNDLSALIRSYHAAHPPTHNTLFLEGAAARATGDPSRAVRLLRRAADSCDLTGFLLPLPELLGPALPNMLGAALMTLGDAEGAAKEFRHALERDPANLEASFGLIGLRLGAGAQQEVLDELDRMARDRGDDCRVWTFGATILECAPALIAEAEAWTEEACRRFPDSTTLRGQLAEARLRCGRAQEALEAWNELAVAGARDEAGRFVASLALGRELPSVPLDKRGAVSDFVLSWFQRWMSASAWEVLDRALVDVGRAEPELPGLCAHTAEWLDRVGQPEAAARAREQVTE